MIYKLLDRSPDIHPSCFVADSADIIGSVILHKNSSIWFNCTIRGDNDTITVGENSNIQDGSVLHVDEGKPLSIGKNVTVGHKVMLHGCTIGDSSLIGINAVVLNQAKIGKGCIIGANALITEGMEIPDGSMVLGAPGKIVKQLNEKNQQLLIYAAQHYVENAKKYANNLTQI